MASPPIDLIIFDCDGVLVDSEPLAMRVLLAAVAEAGIEIDAKSGFRDFLGRSLKAVTARLEETHGVRLDGAALERMRLALYEAFRRELQPTRFVVETLARLEVPFCVASSSQTERIRLSLGVTGLLEAFEPHVFSAELVSRGKPAPDLFLHVAKAMGVVPEHCLVIEDSPAGIAAAQAAGMRVFAYGGGSHFEPAGLRPEVEALAPAALIEDMRALPGLVALHQARHREVPQLLAAVDVGTGSARAGIVDAAGNLLARAESAIAMRRPDANHAEHKSEQIWGAVCSAVRGAMGQAGVRPGEVAGISFDATCSLVVRDREGAPLGVSADGGDDWDTIVWLDHRALAEAAECTASGHAVLDYLGRSMSPEMEVPKLMWLKRHLPEQWAQAGQFFDLADFLSWRASGNNARSQCTLVCKWTYFGHEQPGWQRDFLAAVELEDMLERGGLPERAVPIGTDLGPLTAAAAAELGLTTSCRVGAGLIDAHAGALGTLGGLAGDPETLERHLSLIAGTSSCAMFLARRIEPVPGSWGPYFEAVLPGTWALESGQSATGALLDHIVRWHGAGGEPTPARHRVIVARVLELRASEGSDLAPRLNVLPDFHGNRSPLGDPRALGVISGLTLDSDFDSLCRLYWRTAVAIALGIRHILDTLRERGHAIDALHVTGGHTRNPLLMELYADATGCTVLVPSTQDATLLGVGMVAATAAGLHPSLGAAAAAMRRENQARQPNPAMQALYDRDYRIFLRMLQQRQEIDELS